MDCITWFKTADRKVKIALGVALFLLFYTLFGFFLLPRIVRSILEEKLTESLHRQVAIEQIKFNPYTLTVDVSGFRIQDLQAVGDIAGFKQLFVNLETLSIIKLAPVIKTCRLADPFLKVTRNEDLSYNFSDLLSSEEQRAAPGDSEKEKPFHFSLASVEISGGSIVFVDTPKQTTHTVSDLNLAVPLVSNLPVHISSDVTPAFSAVINETPVSFIGKTRPFHGSRATDFQIHLQGVDLPYYLAYLPGKTSASLNRAFLDLELTLTYGTPADGKPYLGLEGSLILNDIQVLDQQQAHLFSLEQLSVSLAPDNLLENRIHLRDITLSSPYLALQRQKDGSFSIPDWQPDKASAPEDDRDEGEEPSPLIFLADLIRIDQGRVDVMDFAVDQKYTASLYPLNVKVEHLGNRRDDKASFEISTATNSDDVLHLSGYLTLAPLALEGKVSLDSLTLNQFASYYRDQFTGKIASGTLSAVTDFSFQLRDESPDVKLSSLSISLDALEILDPVQGGSLLNVPSFSIADCELDLKEQTLAIGAVASTKGVLNLIREKDSSLNFLNLLAAGKSEPETSPEEKKSSDWLVSLSKANIERYSLDFKDLTTEQPIDLAVADISLKLADLSTAKDYTGSLDFFCRLDRGGTLAGQGSLAVNPVSLQLKTNVDALAVKPFEPYLHKHVHLVLTRGSVSAKGDLSFLQPEGGEAVFRFNGSSGLADFATVDPVYGDDFFKLATFGFEGISFSSNPLALRISSISLDDFYAGLQIDRNGAPNTQTIFVQSQVDDSFAVQEEPSFDRPAGKDDSPSRPDIEIEKIQFSAGRVDFLDQSVSPQYSVTAGKIAGSVNGLSTDESKLANLSLSALVNNSSPLQLTGFLTPLQENKRAELNVDYRGMDMSPLSPYTGKYIGRLVEKGKLVVNVHYELDDRKIKADNSIFLDQFTLGENVDSEEAVSLPIGLAISLLKNRKGEIQLDIPVSGDLDDPEFSLAGTIFKVLVNIITKAVTSPFALLGSLVGGGEDMDAIDFAPGREVLGETGREKLSRLAQALQERPGLKLEISGSVEPASDEKGLREYLFQKQLQTQKLKDLLKKKDENVPAVDEIEIQPDEYEKYLRRAYKVAPFEKEKNFIGLLKKFPVPEVERLMNENIRIGNDELRVLATGRAATVKEFLITSGQIDQERIFLVEPASTASAEAAASRVLITVR